MEELANIINSKPKILTDKFRCNDISYLLLKMKKKSFKLFIDQITFPVICKNFDKDIYINDSENKSSLMYAITGDFMKEALYLVANYPKLLSVQMRNGHTNLTTLLRCDSTEEN